MSRRILRAFLAVSVLCAALAVAPARAQYRYGGYGDSEEAGAFVTVEGGLFNVRNVDNVVAVKLSTPTTPIIPVWDDDFAGRLAVGYTFSGGRKIELSVWSFQTEIDAADTGSFAFTIGPAINSGGVILGDTGSAFNLNTEINARTGDLAYSMVHALNESFSMEWSVGLRYARFEEETLGSYTGGGFVYAVAKRNEGEMFGARAAVRGTYTLGQFFLRGGLGFSMLDGEVTGRSSLTPNPPSAPASGAVFVDDGRSGSIRDFELVGGWKSARGVSLWLGWEQSRWEDLAADPLRNLSGAAVTVRDRSSVALSGYKLGVGFTF